MMKKRYRAGLAVLGAGLVLAPAAPVATAAPANASAAATAPATTSAALQRGVVVSVEAVENLDASGVVERMRQFGYDSSRVRFGVDAFRVVYRTIDAQGTPTTASALMTVPRNDQAILPVAAWLHGTRAYREYVGSVAANNMDRGAGLLLAGAGYATVAPDYLGLGVGPGTHPYVVAEPTVSASVDALRAGREVAAEQHRRLDERVMVSGFSQGGHAAMLVARALQDGADRYLRLGGLAPISGPYDLEHGELAAAVSGRLDPKSATFYLAYLTVAWNRQYHLYDDPAEVFHAPHDQTVPGMFDSDHPEEEIFEALPATPDQLFTPRYLESLRNPSGALRRALDENDTACTGWRPDVPIRMYASATDRDVNIENSQHCLRSFQEVGADASLTDVGDVDHFTSMERALPLVVDWFDTARR